MTIHLAGIMQRRVHLTGVFETKVHLTGVVGVFVPYVPSDGYNGLLLALAFI